MSDKNYNRWLHMSQDEIDRLFERPVYPINKDLLLEEMSKTFEVTKASAIGSNRNVRLVFASNLIAETVNIRVYSDKDIYKAFKPNEYKEAVDYYNFLISDKKK